MSAASDGRRQVVVLAGGLATRMRPMTLAVPKYLLEVAGRPFAAWQLERLAASGFDEAVLCVGHKADEIRAFVGDGARFGLRVAYVDEGERRLGTGGALALALEHGALASELLVLYGDSYLPLDHAAPVELLRASPWLDGVMAVNRNDGHREPGNAAISADGRRVERYAKGGGAALDHIDHGATALRRVAIERARGTRGAGARWGLDELQATLAAAGALGALVVPDRFHEIGSPEGLAALERALAGRVVAGGTRA